MSFDNRRWPHQLVGDDRIADRKATGEYAAGAGVVGTSEHHRPPKTLSLGNISRIVMAPLLGPWCRFVKAPSARPAE